VSVFSTMTSGSSVTEPKEKDVAPGVSDAAEGLPGVDFVSSSDLDRAGREVSVDGVDARRGAR